ncbi:MAG TPA: glycoside hydrolase family 15 protein [Jatrophihabitans sp.]|jgi:glucoamylase|uniref:glycoside hydrolase family 15 protein n=1 Tax=Jatrophihabitans sp. TaxID=1932789 RepID=UPI002DF9B59F|nr:glycoside hydrolase family 15 protein [Jatrophihabitans sp.]
MADYGTVRTSAQQADLGTIAGYLYRLMLRNLASDGFVFTDPADPNRFSAPGCVIASPSYERDLASIRQNYVFNWTRDAAVVALEIAAAHDPVIDGGSGPLDDYVTFAATCQRGTPTLGRACYTIEGEPRAWTDQYDGPAIQSIALAAAFDQLGPDAQVLARAVIERNLAFVVDNWSAPSHNLWEETRGQSFFARSVQLRCLTELRANTLGAAVPAAVDAAIAGLTEALDGHWNGVHYVSVLEPESPRAGYDPNIDIVMAAVYGAVPVTDPRLLATAAQLRAQWTDPVSPVAYPINATDGALGLGPMLGRYPGDVYDGDDNTSGTSHPWALCTANFAELQYRLASAIEADGTVPIADVSRPFFAALGIDDTMPPRDAAARLRLSGDRMLRAVIHHGDHLELSEQFDGTTGYEKSVRNLSWSYAAFLSAARARVSN